LEANAEELKADFALVCDTSMWDEQTPAISAGLRGLVGEEVTVKAADRDLHSGYFGGAAANPIHILTKILADMHDETGRVTIPASTTASRRRRSRFWTPGTASADGRKSPRRDRPVFPSGEKGRSVLELTWARPTAEVNGITGGYAGEGFKTVIAGRGLRQGLLPACAQAGSRKDPRGNFRAFVRDRIPADCSVDLPSHGGSPAVQLAYDSRRSGKAKKALSDEWPKPAVMIAMGGSIPVVGDFQKISRHGIDAGRLRPVDDRIHSPNEKYNLDSFHKGATLLGADPLYF
jgi:acetylornithine deacetylase/succinyl-diaminopimelate desuccinylase-like protein